MQSTHRLVLNASLNLNQKRSEPICFDPQKPQKSLEWKRLSNEMDSVAGSRDIIMQTFFPCFGVDFSTRQNWHLLQKWSSRIASQQGGLREEIHNISSHHSAQTTQIQQRLSLPKGEIHHCENRRFSKTCAMNAQLFSVPKYAIIFS